MTNLQIAHFGLRSRNLPASIEWYSRALEARVNFRNELAAFMSFDEEHHRFVLWDDGDTGEKPENARGVDHIGFACAGPTVLADEYARLKEIGITPFMAVNHSFTSSLYYHDPDGNEVEITCDNFPTKSECLAFMRTDEMAQVMQPPLFGAEFEPEELLNLRRSGASGQEMARIGLSGR